MFEQKKYRGVIFHGTEEKCKIWKKNWLVVWKTTWGIWQIFATALESLKIGTLSLKFTEELRVMTMKNDAKFEEELTCRFNIDIRNLTNFDPTSWKSQK